MTIWDSLVVREEDRPILYAGTYTGTGNSRVLRYDYLNGSIDYYPLEDTKGAYGLAWDDGTLYVGTIDKAKLFRVNAASNEITDLGTPAPDEQYIWRLAKSAEGRIYAATYPGCKLLEYDPANGQWRDHGPMHSERQYAIALATSDEGSIYVGIGTPAALILYNSETGAKTQVPLGEDSKAAFAYPAYEDGLVYVRFAGSDSLLILDSKTQEVLLRLDGKVDGRKYSYSRPSVDSSIVITGFPDGLKGFNRADRSLVDAAVPFGALFDATSGVRFEISPVEIRAIAAQSGDTLHSVDVSRDGEGMAISSMSLGPDGCLYGGVYNLLHLWRYDPSSRLLADLGTASPGHSGQYYDFCVVDQELIMGSYTHAVLTTYNPANAWSPGAEAESNPRVLGPLGEDQYRPVALHAGTDGMVYIGSLPTYGQVGGALSTLDPSNDSIVVHRSLIGDHSVGAVTSDDRGRIFAGTSLASTDPAHTFDPPEAMVFQWDQAAANVVRKAAPIPKARAIHSLMTLREDLLLGCADKSLFVMNSTTLTTLGLLQSDVGAVTRMRRAPDGRVIGISSSALVEIKVQEPDEIEMQKIGPGGVDFEIASNGDVYIAQGPEVFLLEGLLAPQSPSTLATEP